VDALCAGTGWFSKMRSTVIKTVLRNAACAALSGTLLVVFSAQVPAQNATPQTLKPASPIETSTEKTPKGNARLSQEIQITGDQFWTDTGIDVQPGEHIIVSAGGKLRYADAKDDNGPDGLARSFKDLIRILPFNAAGRGALIGRIGDAAIAEPFVLGAQRDVVATVGGRFAIGINQMNDDTGDGTYTVRIEIHAPDAGSTNVAVRQVEKILGVDAALFSNVPRRVADKDGAPGDMVNFLIIGSEDAMQKVFKNAGWVKVDADVQGTVLHGILESLSKKSYLTMPMSPLYLFGRTQDYGWAHAEPIKVIASRNHLRIWKAALKVNGQTLWVGAATHDIGFERDNRNDGITHKIDPAIDLERDYVEKTLAATGLVAEITHFLPDHPLKEATTATGGSFHSDGRVLVLKLTGSGKDVSPGTARSK
jgi:hypothetical protein